MAITKDKKAEQLAALEAKFKDAAGVAFASFTTLTVEEAQVVRRELREQNMSYTVIKKTLMALAAKNTGLAEFSADDLDGSVAVIVSPDDAIAPAAAIKKFRKDYVYGEDKVAKFDYAGSVFEGKFLSSAETAELANIPSREESLAKIVGMLRSGPQKLHGVFQSGMRGLVNVLNNGQSFAAPSA